MAKFILFSLLLIFGLFGVKSSRSSSSLSSAWVLETSRLDGALEHSALNEEVPPTTCSSASGRSRNCAEIQRALNVSGVQACAIYPLGSNSTAVEVLCDFETDGGGWTFIQKREKGPKEEFYRNWADYAAGFYGSESEGARGNYWIGLDVIYALTNPSSNQSTQSLRVDLTDWNNTSIFAQYSRFYIADSSKNYTLYVGRYLANSSATDRLARHNGYMFSTPDRDNDDYGGGSCAQRFKGAWWYFACQTSSLNGLYLTPDVDASDDPDTGIYWDAPQKTTSMKIRDADFTKSLFLD